MTGDQVWLPIEAETALSVLERILGTRDSDMGVLQIDKDLILEVVEVAGVEKVDSGTRDVLVSVVKLMIVRNELAHVEHEIMSVMLSTTVWVVHVIDLAGVDIGMSDVRVSVVKVVSVVIEFAQVEHWTVSVTLLTTVAVVHKLDTRVEVDTGTRDVNVSVLKLTIVLSEFAQWEQETIFVTLSTTVLVVQEADVEEAFGLGTVIVETGTRDDKVSVDRLMMVRNEF